MKSVILLILMTIYGFACSGNCILCHPKLKDSIDKPHHKLLHSCIKCHTKLPEGMTECGGDCFECHSRNKLIKSNTIEHQKLSACKECHINKEDILKSPNIINNETNMMDFFK